MMMVLVALACVHGNHASVLGDRAAYMFELHRGVANLKALGEKVIQTLQRAFAG